MRKKSKKPVGGVYASQDWSQKKLLSKEFVFIIPVTRVSNGIGGKAEFDTLGKTVSAHHAGGPTPHEGWVPHLRWVGGEGGSFPLSPTTNEGFFPHLQWVRGGRSVGRQIVFKQNRSIYLM